MIKNVYMLDRNVIDRLGRSYDALRDDQKEMVDKIKGYDQADSLFSCLLSSVEGEKGRPHNFEEFKSVLLKESNILRRFLNKGKTDSYLLPNSQERVFEAFSDDVLMPNKLSKEFLIEVAPLIYENTGKAKIVEKCEELTEICKKIIGVADLTYILSLAVVCRNDNARRIIKPSIKNYDPYNAVNDISILKMVCNLRGQTPNCNVQLVSHDKSLNEIASTINLKLNGVELGEADDIHSYKLDLPRSLFGDIDEEIYWKLIDMIEGFSLN
ncbi:hypothetical protein ABMA58_03130 [Oceanospirillum sp. HFRX-1_2]